MFDRTYSYATNLGFVIAGIAGTFMQFHKGKMYCVSLLRTYGLMLIKEICYLGCPLAYNKCKPDKKDASLTFYLMA